jgi:hypothetical protein
MMLACTFTGVCKRQRKPSRDRQEAPPRTLN